MMDIRAREFIFKVNVKLSYSTVLVCGGKYTSEFGLVEPPPQLPGNTLCSFLLSPTDAKTINATFITFSFGSTGESRSKRFYKSCQDADTYIEVFRSL